MKYLIIPFLLLYGVLSFGQDGSNIWYIKGQYLDSSSVNEFVHLDFYRRSFRGKPLDTVSIQLNGKPIKFVERRKDDGFNNWFFEQYLESLEFIDKQKIRIEKCQIKEVRLDSILVVNYFVFYDASKKVLPEKSFRQECWFRRDIIQEVLVWRER